jgi:hypothetical protein
MIGRIELDYIKQWMPEMYRTGIHKALCNTLLVLTTLSCGFVASGRLYGQVVAAEQAQASNQKLRITYVGSNQGAAPITFENFRNVLFFKGSINGSEAVILLDNAADFTTVDDGFAKRAGLKPDKPTKTINTGTAKIEAKTIKDVRLDIPRHIAISGTLMSRDLQPLARLMNHRIDAILGADVINAHALGVINTQNKLYILPSGRIKPKAGSVVAPLSNGGEVYGIINGVPVRLYVDFGFNGSITLSPDSWSRVIPSDSSTTGSRFTGGEGNVSKSIKSFGNTVEIGGYALKGIAISLAPSRPRGVDGLLGVDILSRFDVVLDVPASRLVLIPRDVH